MNYVFAVINQHRILYKPRSRSVVTISRAPGSFVRGEGKREHIVCPGLSCLDETEDGNAG